MIEDYSLIEVDGKVLLVDNRTKKTVWKERIKKPNSREKTSQYKGVHFDSRSGKFKAQIYNKGKIQYLGCYDDEVQAAKAYDYHYTKKTGDYKNRNFQISAPRPSEPKSFKISDVFK